ALWPQLAYLHRGRMEFRPAVETDRTRAGLCRMVAGDPAWSPCHRPRPGPTGTDPGMHLRPIGEPVAPHPGRTRRRRCGAGRGRYAHARTDAGAGRDGGADRRWSPRPGPFTTTGATCVCTHDCPVASA